MVVRELFTKMGMDVDAAGFTEAILAADAVKGALGQLKNALVGVAKGFVSAITDTSAAASNFDDLAKKTGISRTALQELAYAGDQAGTSFDSIVVGLRNVAKNSVEAVGGNEEMAAAFSALGVSARDAGGKLKAPEILLGEIAEGLNGLGSENERTNLAMKVFGKSGQDLLPFLKEGKDGIQLLKDEAHLLNLVMSDEAVAAGDNFGDNLGKLDALWKGLKQTLVGPVLAAINENVTLFIEWAKANRGLIKEKVDLWAGRIARAFRAIAEASKALRAILKGLKLALFLVGGALLGLAIPAAAAGLVALGGIIGQVAMATAMFGTGAIWAGVKAAIGVALPVIGWILLGALILLAFEDLMTFFKGGDSMIGRFLAGPWKSLSTAVSKMWGDLKLLAGEAWQWVEDTATGAINRIIATFKSLPGRIADYIPGGRTALDYWFPGGGASPTANANQSAAGSNVAVSSPKMNVNFVMNTGPGADAGEVAGEVEKRLEKFWTTKMDENYVALQGG